METTVWGYIIRAMNKVLGPESSVIRVVRSCLRSVSPKTDLGESSWRLLQNWDPASRSRVLMCPELVKRRITRKMLMP